MLRLCFVDDDDCCCCEATVKARIQACLEARIQARVETRVQDGEEGKGLEVYIV